MPTQEFAIVQPLVEPRRHILNGRDPKPRTMLVIESRDSGGASALCAEVEVLRPSGPERQSYQMAAAVTQLFPDARLKSIASDSAVFICRDSVITAFYEQIQ